MAATSQLGGVPQIGPLGSIHSMGAPMSMAGMGSMPYLPYGPGPGSAIGSDYGGVNPQMGMLGMGMGPFGPQSMYGNMMMGPGAPRNSVMTNLNMFGGPGSVVGGGGGGSSAGGLGNTGPRPVSSFSMDPFGGGGGPNPSENPSDDELVTVLRHYLSTQDLMTVTKK